MMKAPTKEEIKKMVIDGLKQRGIDVPENSNQAGIISDLVDRTDLFGGDIFDEILPVGITNKDLDDAFGVSADAGIVFNEPVCECGAKHTDFPDNHYDFCPKGKQNA